MRTAGWVLDLFDLEIPDQSLPPRHLQSGGIKIFQSKRVTVTGSDMRLAQNRGPMGNGYGFCIYQSNEVLVENCTSEKMRHNFITNGRFGTSGNVFSDITSSGGWGFLGYWDDYASRFLVREFPPLGHPGLGEFHQNLHMANLVENSRLYDGWNAMNRESMSSNSGHTSTGCVFWNIEGNKGSQQNDFLETWDVEHISNPGLSLIRSYQYEDGYVIGTKNMYVMTNVFEDVEPFEALFSDAVDSVLDYLVNTLFLNDLLYYVNQWGGLSLPEIPDNMEDLITEFDLGAELDFSFGSTATSPDDYTEHIDSGYVLDPSSLYESQLEKRTSR